MDGAGGGTRRPRSPPPLPPPAFGERAAGGAFGFCEPRLPSPRRGACCTAGDDGGGDVFSVFLCAPAPPRPRSLRFEVRVDSSPVTATADDDDDGGGGQEEGDAVAMGIEAATLVTSGGRAGAARVDRVTGEERGLLLRVEEEEEGGGGGGRGCFPPREADVCCCCCGEEGEEEEDAAFRGDRVRFASPFGCCCRCCCCFCFCGGGREEADEPNGPGAIEPVCSSSPLPPPLPPVLLVLLLGVRCAGPTFFPPAAAAAAAAVISFVSFLPPPLLPPSPSPSPLPPRGRNCIGEASGILTESSVPASPPSRSSFIAVVGLLLPPLALCCGWRWVFSSFDLTALPRLLRELRGDDDNGCGGC